VVDRIEQTTCYDQSGKRFEPTKEMCSGYGDTFFRGIVNGKSVYAVFTIMPAAPCCVWFSYKLGDPMDRESANRRTIVHKIRIEQPKSIDLNNADDIHHWTIDLNPETRQPWPADEGPLRGGVFIPVKCSSQN
jgi:hypothetical protein